VIPARQLTELRYVGPDAAPDNHHAAPAIRPPIAGILIIGISP
jgi:hypothetical protein